jgi:HK97 gp10 family phage protein
MARKIITGLPELEKTLKNLADKTADKIARSALRAGVVVVAKAEKAAAPVGKTGQLKASIGSRVGKGRSGIFQAKAGVNVGKRTKAKQAKGPMAPHAHLAALGTQPRLRKRLGGRFSNIKNPTPQQLSTGSGPANPFIRNAYNSARSRAMDAMSKQAAKTLARELAKSK